MASSDVEKREGGARPKADGLAERFEHRIAMMMDMMPEMVDRMNRIEAGHGQRDPNPAAGRKGRQALRQAKKKRTTMKVMKERAGLTEGETEEEESESEESEEDKIAVIAWLQQQTKDKKVKRRGRLQRLG